MMAKASDPKFAFDKLSTLVRILATHPGARRRVRRQLGRRRALTGRALIDLWHFEHDAVYGGKV